MVVIMGVVLATDALVTIQLLFSYYLLTANDVVECGRIKIIRPHKICTDCCSSNF